MASHAWSLFPFRGLLGLLDAAEEGWRQLDQTLGNRLFETLNKLRDDALSVLDRIRVPNVFMYLSL